MNRWNDLLFDLHLIKCRCRLSSLTINSEDFDYSHVYFELNETRQELVNLLKAIDDKFRECGINDEKV